MSHQDSVINDFSKTKLWHRTISPHSMLIGYAVERGIARVSEQPARIEPLVILLHTAQYFLEYTTESWEEKKSQAMGFNNTHTVRGITRENHDFEKSFLTESWWDTVVVGLSRVNAVNYTAPSDPIKIC